jgi:hypothetical protein
MTTIGQHDLKKTPVTTASRQAYVTRVQEFHKTLPKDRVPLTLEELVNMIHESRRACSVVPD